MKLWSRDRITPILFYNHSCRESPEHQFGKLDLLKMSTSAIQSKVRIRNGVNTLVNNWSVCGWDLHRSWEPRPASCDLREWGTGWSLKRHSSVRLSCWWSCPHWCSRRSPRDTADTREHLHIALNNAYSQFVWDIGIYEGLRARLV